MAADAGEYASAEALPRDPSAYRPAEPDVVLKARERGVSGEAIAETIREGYVKSAGENRVRFATEMNGFIYRVIVERQPTEQKHEVVEICQPQFIGGRR